jgi:hypothetical protein
LVNAVCGSAQKLTESTQPVSAGSTRISEKYFEPCDSAEGKYQVEPESRIELLTYSLRVIWHSTLC